MLSKYLIRLFRYELLIPSSQSCESDTKFPAQELRCLRRVKSVCCEVAGAGAEVFRYFGWHRRRCELVYCFVH